MEKFTEITAIAAPILRINIDTDIIIPSREMKRVSIPLLYGYTKQGDFKRVWFLFGLYKRTRSSAAWELRLFWLFKFRGGDADRIEEIEP